MQRDRTILPESHEQIVTEQKKTPTIERFMDCNRGRMIPSKIAICTCLMSLSSVLWAEQELPNFEVALGGGLGKDIPTFNLDFTVNIPITESLSAQVNLDSNYIFDDPEYDDYSMSEFNALGFYRFPNGRLGSGLGMLEKKSRDDKFETERKGVTHFLASYYIKDFTLDWRYAKYDGDLDRSLSLQLGVVWYPNMVRRVRLYREHYGGGDGWRLDVFTQPKEYHQQLSFGAVIRDGKGDSFPYIGAEVRYYFDRAITIKDRDRRYH